MYLRIKLKGHQRAFFLSIIKLGKGFILGRKVNRQGVDNSWTDAKGVVHDQQQFIAREAIEWTEEVDMDRKYGDLVVVEESRVSGGRK